VLIKKIGHSIAFLLILSSCIYPFDPPSEDYENLLVVEAFLSDGDEAFEVKLSRSIPINTDGRIPEENAQISISDNIGNIFDLYEEEPGKYLTSSDFLAYANRIYQLHIQTSDGEEYASDSVFLRETPPIDSVFYKYEERTTGEFGVIVPGLQIYLTTHDSNNETWYYRWDFEETWEFRSYFRSDQIWDNGIVREREEQIHLCWKSDESTRVLVSTSKNLGEDIISEFPVRYISNSTDRLRSKYSILVKQYALSEQSYNYWKEMEKVNENLGTLFDPQPSVIKGNIHNIHDENDVALGYFDAASVQEQRIFIKRGEYPYFVIPDPFADCEQADTIVGYFLVPEMILRGYEFVGAVPAESGGFGGYRLASLPCVDCTIFGINVKPDFWD